MVAPATLRVALRSATRKVPSFVCPSCQLRTNSVLRPLGWPSISYSSSTEQRPRGRPFSSTARRNAYSLLKNRSVIRLAGKDAAHFLDGLLPAKILSVGPEPIYTAFLTAQGRILVDVFLYPPKSQEDPEWFIEVDVESSDLLMKHLKKHKLRSKFTLERLQEPPLYHFESKTPASETDLSAALGSTLRTGGSDPRPGMQSRYIITDPSGQATELEALFGPQTDESGDEYMKLRMSLGLAEGQQELTSTASLPQESNIDLLNGIDFHKGCYLGQELTIRTHHTGVVRKRILPVELYQDSESASPAQPVEEVPSGSNLSKVSTRKGRSTGKLLRSHGNLGLALCRLEMMTDIQLTADATNFNPEEKYKVSWQDAAGNEKSVFVRPIMPGWLRDGVEASLKRKERRPPKRELEEEEEDVD
jgi:folate-binding protein YgfZ